jgi:hypothetical protein
MQKKLLDSVVQGKTALKHTQQKETTKKTEIAAKRYDGNVQQKKLATRTTTCLRSQKAKCTMQWSPQ